MIIINKKRLNIILLFLLITTIIFEAKAGSRNEKTKETATLPVSSKVIILDAGHRISR